MGDPNDKVSGILSSLPLETLIGAPLMAASIAQVQLSNATCDYIKQVGFDDNGNVKMISMGLTETDASGGTKNLLMNVPLITILNVPSLAIQTVSVDFTIEVDAMSEKKSTSTTESTSAFGIKASAGYKGWWGGSFSGSTNYNTTARLSSLSSNNDKLNTKAKYVVHLEAQDKQPVGLSKLLDRLTDNDKLVPKATVQATT
jgi:hypothetical protein